MAFNENGLVIKRYNEILTDIQDDQIANIPKKFKYQDNKLAHQLNSVYALQAERLAQLIEAAFSSIKLQNAEGRHLEELGLIRGVYRLGATPSQTTSQYAWLAPGTVIPAGTLFTSSLVSDEAVNTETVTGTASNCDEAIIRINTALNNTVYSVTVNGDNYQLVTLSAGWENPETIRDFLLPKFQNAGSFGAIPEGSDSIRLVADSGTSLSVNSNTTYISIDLVKVYFYVQLTSIGPNAVPAGLMDGIRTSISGFESTSNDEDFTLGREREVDSDLRLRIINGSAGDCTGTVLTIENALLTNVPGVSYARVIENTNQYPTDSDGRPQGSYETVVLGGTNEDVAQEIWRTKPAGVQLFGNTSLFVDDTSGRERYIQFSRPVPKHLSVRVRYEVYGEEDLTTELQQAITDAVVEYVRSLPLGKDFIPTRLYGTIYSNTTGLGRIVVDAGVIATPGDPASFSSADIPISDVEYASITEADVVVQPL